MAVRWAVASGLWSATSTWDGLVAVPASGDTVHADGFTVTIDVSVNLGTGTLNTTQRSGGTVGGQFVLNDGVTVTAATFTAGASGASTAGWLLSGTASATLVGDLAGGATTSATVGAFHSTSSGTLTITGNVPFPTTNTYLVRQLSGGGNITVVGNVGSVAGGGTSNARAIGFSSTGSLSVTGTVTGGAGTGNYGVMIETTAPTAVTVVGNQLAGTSSSGYAILVAVTNTPITITGNVTASGCPAVGFNATAVVTSTIIGTLTSYSYSAAVESSTGTGLMTLTGPFITGPAVRTVPFISLRVALSPIANSYFEWRDDTGVEGSAYRLYSTDTTPTVPTAANVRTGTTYGAFTGTMAVPTAGQVMADVAVDATVGSLALTPAAAAQAVWDYLRASAVTADSMGLRLANTTTVDSTGAQIAAL